LKLTLLSVFTCAGKNYIITFAQSAKTPEIESLYQDLESQGERELSPIASTSVPSTSSSFHPSGTLFANSRADSIIFTLASHLPGSHISKKAHESGLFTFVFAFLPSFHTQPSLLFPPSSVIMKYSVATLEPAMLQSLKGNNIIESIGECLLLQR